MSDTDTDWTGIIQRNNEESKNKIDSLKIQLDAEKNVVSIWEKVARELEPHLSLAVAALERIERTPSLSEDFVCQQIATETLARINGGNVADKALGEG
jgi:hypothetical protein